MGGDGGWMGCSSFAAHLSTIPTYLMTLFTSVISSLMDLTQKVTFSFTLSVLKFLNLTMATILGHPMATMALRGLILSVIDMDIFT
jgi:hypothetical protein